VKAQWAKPVWEDDCRKYRRYNEQMAYCGIIFLFASNSNATHNLPHFQLTKFDVNRAVIPHYKLRIRFIIDLHISENDH